MCIADSINFAASVFLVRDLPNTAGSRPPKIEVTGVLVPCNELVSGYRCRFKIQSKFTEYFLRLSPPLAFLARRFEGEEVTIRGALNSDGLLHAEKIKLAPSTRSCVSPTKVQ